MYTIDDFSKMAGLPQTKSYDMKVMKDGFVYKLVTTEKAKQILYQNLFELYSIYDDDSESLIETLSDLDRAIEQGNEIGIPVGLTNKL